MSENQDTKLLMENTFLRNCLEKYANKQYYIRNDRDDWLFDYAHYLGEPWKFAKEIMDKEDHEEEFQRSIRTSLVFTADITKKKLEDGEDFYQATIDCPYCEKKHHHSGFGLKKGKLQGRSAHCDSDKSPMNHYFLYPMEDTPSFKVKEVKK